MSTTHKETTHKETTQEETTGNVREGITTAKEFHTENVTITEPRKRKNTSGDINFNALILHNNRPLYLETPWLRAPFGCGSFEKDGKKNYSLALNPVGCNLDDEEEQEIINNFFDQLENLDAKLLDYGWDNRDVGFFSDVPEVKAVVKALYSKCVKQDKEKLYPRRINLTFPKARDEDNNILDNVPGFDIYKGSKIPCEVESFDDLVASINGKPNPEPHLIEKGAFCRAILQPRIWFIAGKYGLSWNIRALELKSITKVNFKGKYVFSRPEGDDDDDEEEASVEEKSVEERSVEDSEEEVEEEEEEGSEEEEEEEET